MAVLYHCLSYMITIDKYTATDSYSIMLTLFCTVHQDEDPTYSGRQLTLMEQRERDETRSALQKEHYDVRKARLQFARDGKVQLEPQEQTKLEFKTKYRENEAGEWDFTLLKEFRRPYEDLILCKQGDDGERQIEWRREREAEENEQAPNFPFVRKPPRPVTGLAAAMANAAEFDTDASLTANDDDNASAETTLVTTCHTDISVDVIDESATLLNGHAHTNGHAGRLSPPRNGSARTFNFKNEPLTDDIPMTSQRSARDISPSRESNRTDIDEEVRWFLHFFKCCLLELLCNICIYSLANTI